eukprot:scaffold5613_cov133-Isochrysis_galbana.AAC.3
MQSPPSSVFGRHVNATHRQKNATHRQKSRYSTGGSTHDHSSGWLRQADREQRRWAQSGTSLSAHIRPHNIICVRWSLS